MSLLANPANVAMLRMSHVTHAKFVMQPSLLTAVETHYEFQNHNSTERLTSHLLSL